MMVRQAVLKGKDPLKLLQEMESIDRMGTFISLIVLYDIYQQNC